MNIRYSLNTFIMPKRGRNEVYMERPNDFYLKVQQYTGAFLNTCGGVMHFGVSNSGRVVGISCTRTEEDGFKLTLDNIVKLFQPKVSPSLYRLDFVPVVSPHITGDNWRVISLHVSAGPEIMYMDGSERVMVMATHGLYGPLIPQEIQRLAIHKYKQELLNAENLMNVITPVPNAGRHTKKLDKRPKSPPKKQNSSPAKKLATKATACTMSQTTPGLINNACARCPDDTSGDAPASSQDSPTECSNTRQTSTPQNIICLDDSVVIVDLESTIITIRDSSDSDSSVIILDQTGSTTPIRSPSDLFASPGCSTIKKVPQERPEPESPSRFPEKRSRFPEKPSDKASGAPSHGGAKTAIKHTLSDAALFREKKKLRKS